MLNILIVSSNKHVKLEVNSRIKEILNNCNISIHDGLSYLLCLYYELEPSFIPNEIIRRISASGIVEKDLKTGNFKWNVDLFEESDDNLEWIGEWMDLFKEKNPERRGTRSLAIKRMKSFYMNNPFISKAEVFEATKMYLQGVSQPKYCKKSHKFIKEQDGSSMLKEYIDILRERNETEEEYNRKNVI